MWQLGLLPSMDPRVRIPRKVGGSCMSISDLASEAVQHYFCHTLRVVEVPSAWLESSGGDYFPMGEWSILKSCFKYVLKQNLFSDHNCLHSFHMQNTFSPPKSLQKSHPIMKSGSASRFKFKCGPLGVAPQIFLLEYHPSQSGDLWTEEIMCPTMVVQAQASWNRHSHSNRGKTGGTQQPLVYRNSRIK